ncbi:MAG: ATP-dependent zinc metalloprotease FtsH [Spirochaetaceae bacterium]|jgi:cell division protease FtsH|nr:ATP-dependent zinc metalloprotease FtsH [Spirochaetaceae bacterium]
MADNNNEKQDNAKDYEPEQGEKRPLPPLPKMEKPRFGFLLSLLIAAAVGFFYLHQNSTPVRQVAYTDFMDSVAHDKLTSVTIYGNSTIEWSRPGNNGALDYFKTIIPYQDPALLPSLTAKGIRVVGSAGRITFGRILVELLPWLIGFLFIWLMLRSMQGGIGGKGFQFGKSRAKRYLDHSKKVVFADVAGQEDAKAELQEVVAFLKAPEKFTKIGAKIPKGVLLVGMPGTGKTLMARAVAGEAGVAFFHMSGSDFVEMFVGVGASRVRDLFEQGRRASPCIIFIDELDAVGRTRGAGYGGGHDEREQTLNQMLVEMDGFDSKEGVIILAATNRPDVLDPALLRPGRFDRQVVVAMPDLNEREAILKIHSAKIMLDKSVDIPRIARATPGMSGADISNLVNEAALLAARGDKETVEMIDFEEARDKIFMGVARKSLAISEKERKMTAFHEAGHALLHYFLENSDPLHKVTIIPHGKALGMAMSLPEQDKYAHTRAWLLDRIVICYGGWAAEKLTFSETTTGTQADLEQATGMARQMVCEWGMSEDLGPIIYGQKEEPIFLGKEIARHKDYSEETARHIDAAIRRILDESRSRAEELLTANKTKLECLALALLEKETLVDDEIRALLGLPKRANSASLVD